MHCAGPLGLCPAPFPVRDPTCRGAGQGLFYVPQPHMRCSAERKIFAPPHPEANTKWVRSGGGCRQVEGCGSGEIGPCHILDRCGIGGREQWIGGGGGGRGELGK